MRPGAKFWLPLSAAATITRARWLAGSTPDTVIKLGPVLDTQVIEANAVRSISRF